MKLSLLCTSAVLLSAMSINSVMAFSTKTTIAASMSDDMALEEGMTPIENIVWGLDAIGGEVKFNRADYVSTYPSADDIARVIASHRQVIVVNKQAKGPEAQTLRIYENGAIKQLFENKTITNIVNGKKVSSVVKEYKDFVKISTGREKEEVAASGRHYFSTTPKGFFRPQRVYKMYYSNTWKADMPNAVFINCSRNNFSTECGIAVHATSSSHYAALGSRDSGGCIRTKLEVSEQVRKTVMDSGKGSEDGTYGITTESFHRNRVTNNSLVVDLVNRDSGEILNQKVNSWDTVIVVYE